ncbi:MAG: TetR/AcrR family transcriptional regulator [Sandaracinaceae bacterium]
MARPREFDEEEVLNKAMEVFWLRGYRATTPQALVEATGLSKSSLYATFESKNRLFLAVLRRYAELHLQHIRLVLSNESLRAGLEQLYEMLVTNSTSGRTCLLCSTSIEAPRDDRTIADLIARTQERTEDVLHERLVRAQKEGELSPERDARGLARMIISTNTGLMVLARSNPDPDWVRPIAKEMLRTLL